MVVIGYQKSGRFPRPLVIALITALLSFVCACAAASRPPSATGTNPNATPYPVLLTDEEGDRRQAALTAWTVLTRTQGQMSAPEPELQPVTSTIRSLPKLSAPLYLPKVGEGATMNEEEARESLRRFVNSNHELLGIDPQQLSLVLRTDVADGTKRALYEQRPFRYPFRNGFGIVEISFAPDRRILELKSTAIPEIDRMRLEIERLRTAGITTRTELATAELVIKSLTGRTITYTDAGGRAMSYTLTNQNRIMPRELVIFPQLRQGNPPALEFHLAWEIMIEGAPVRAIYLDAITNEIIDATANAAS